VSWRYWHSRILGCRNVIANESRIFGDISENPKIDTHYEGTSLTSYPNKSNGIDIARLAIKSSGCEW